MATQEVARGGISTLEAAPEPKQHRGLWTDAWRRLIRNRLAITAVVLLVAITLIAFVGAYVGPLARYDSNDQNYDAVQQGPSAEHWFGTDQLGRDMFARVLEGIRISLQIGVGAALVVLIMGLSVGAAAAMGGKWSDNLLMRFADVMISLPEILAIILLRSVLIGHSWPVVTNKKMIIILAIGLVAWITVARLVRGQMLSLAERDFVIAARALGASRWRIVSTHMLPNTLGPVIVAVTFAHPGSDLRRGGARVPGARVTSACGQPRHARQLGLRRHPAQRLERRLPRRGRGVADALFHVRRRRPARRAGPAHAVAQRTRRLMRGRA